MEVALLCGVRAEAASDCSDAVTMALGDWLPHSGW